MKNGNYLSEQLSFLPDVMVEEAMASEQNPPRKHTTIRILRVAACFMVILGLLFGFPNPKSSSNENIVVGPGLLAVKVCATSAHSSAYVEASLEEGVVIPENAFMGSTNSYVGIPIHLSVASKDFPFDKITYRLSSTAGVYADNERHGYTSDWFSTITCGNDSTVRWNLMYDAGSGWYESRFDHCFSHILIYCEDHIIGYAVIYYNRLYTDEWAKINPEMGKHYADLDEPLPLDVFYCALLESVSFPKIDGKYQDISPEYVQERLDKACVIPTSE